MITRSTIVLAAAALLAASPATAQKSADTLRLAMNNPFAQLSPYHLPLDEAGYFYRYTYESLIAYDEHKGKFVPQLATSWQRISPTVLEFELRQDVSFHNGDRFSADDVVNTFNYLADPKTTLRYKNRYSWVKSAEKLGPYKVRITTTKPNAIDLGLIAYRYSILDAKVHMALKNKTDYGFNPIGTGIYRVADLDKNRGITAERWDGYHGNMDYTRAPIATVKGLPLPDRQTQIAQLLTGGIDVVVNVIQDQAKALKKEKGIKVTNLPGGSFIYFALDSAGRSGNEAIKDPRVREAIHAAIDRESIIKYIVPGDGAAEMLDVPCFKTTIACQYTRKPPKYDLARAKRLLAEAGYPNGFDLTYDAYAPIKDIAVAVAGSLRKAGIRVTVNALPITVYRKKQRDGALQAWSVFYPLGTHPDVSSAIAVWFNGARANYFNRDKVVLDAMKAGQSEMDPVKRANIYQTALDRITEMHYVIPISSLPLVFAHSQDVRIMPNQTSSSFVYIGDYAWN